MYIRRIGFLTYVLIDRVSLILIYTVHVYSKLLEATVYCERMKLMVVGILLSFLFLNVCTHAL